MIRIKTERLMKSILTLKALIVGKVLRVKNTGQGVPAGAVAEDKRIKGKEKEASGGGPRTVQGAEAGLGGDPRTVQGTEVGLGEVEVVHESAGMKGA